MSINKQHPPNTTDTLIEKCRTEIEEGNEAEFSMNVQNYPKEVSLSGPLPHVKLADLLAQETALNGSSETLPFTSSNQHLPEEVSLSGPLPHVKLADLLAQETDDASSEEVDTGPPVGNEIW